MRIPLLLYGLAVLVRAGFMLLYPAMYWISLVILLAPIAVVLRRLPRPADEAR